MSEELQEDLEGFVSTWPRIAAFMNLGVRTVQRLYAEYGLPVMMLPSGTPCAMKWMLTQWVMKCDEIVRKERSKERGKA